MSEPILNRLDPGGRQHYALGAEAAEVTRSLPLPDPRAERELIKALVAIETRVTAAGGRRHDVIAATAMMVAAFAARRAELVQAEDMRATAVAALEPVFVKLGSDLAAFALSRHPNGDLPESFANGLREVAALHISRALAVVGGTSEDAERAGEVVSKVFTDVLDARSTE